MLPLIRVLTLPLLLSAPQGSGNAVREAADRAELERLESVWNDAHVRGDAEALDRLWADELTVTVPGMPMMTKADSIGVWRTGRLRFQRYETSDVRFQLFGDSAVVTGRVQRARNMNGRSVEEDWRFTKTYVRTQGAWRVVAWHASP
jgi:ketosteroid isomerase-like protein